MTMGFIKATAKKLTTDALVSLRDATRSSYRLNGKMANKAYLNGHHERVAQYLAIEKRQLADLVAINAELSSRGIN
jgi:hypothetical protein